ncbi:MAG: DMT family transporter [Anaerovoracaceae bacterium]|jgi:RarD protein
MAAKMKIVSAMFLFGTIGLFVRGIELPSPVIALIRAVIGTAFLFVLCIGMRKKIDLSVVKKNGLKLVLAGVCIGANWVCLFEAYKHTTIVNATLSYYMAPVFVIALSPVVLGERLSFIKVAGVLVSLLGMACISGVFNNTSAGAGAKDIIGIQFGIIAAVGYATVTFTNKFIKDLPSLESTMFQLGVAAITLLPYTLVMESRADLIFDSRTILLLAVLGVVHTGLAFWFYFSSIQDLLGQTIAIFSYIDPLTAIIMSALILGEPLGAMQIIGAILILGPTFKR